MAIQENVLFSFGIYPSATGDYPYASLIADNQGNLYGTTSLGGSSNTGAVFELDKSTGVYNQQTLFSFAARDPSTGANTTGAEPFAGLIADGQGNLYGTTYYGGNNNTGAVFELIKGPSGYSEHTLFSFAARDPNTLANATGANPLGSLIADAQGNFYGTTSEGGSSNAGVVFELVNGANGYSQQVLFSFAANNPNNGANATGAAPRAGLLADAQGNLYGAAAGGGSDGTGAVFELVKGASGYSEQILFSFAALTGRAGPDTTGAEPFAGLIADAQGNLYGTTRRGGSNDTGAVFELVRGSNGYSQQTLFSFAAKDLSTGANATGANPEAGLIADAQGNLYGTTIEGGSNDVGTVFELVKSANGYSEQTLLSFAPPAANTGANATGAQPFGGLIADAQGNLYGTTTGGGSNGTGTVYELTGTGFAPVCYCTGTGIRALRDGAEVDVAVEQLRVGDLVVTAAAAHRPIRWIGHRDLDGGAHPLPHDQQPVRIRQGAFGADADGNTMPARDLFLSPGHPVLVGADADGEGGALVPVMCLVNGTTVARVAVESVSYWHVELDAHDILLAEGLPAESYLDWGDRAFFSDAPAHALANPDFVVPGLGLRCRPVAVAGAVVEAERRRLDAVFAGHLGAMCSWPAGEAVSLLS